MPSDHSTILEFDPVAPVNIDYLPAEYCLDSGFQFLIPSRDDWGPNTVAHPEHLDIYTDCSKLDNGVGRGISSGKLDISISLRLPDYCSVVQADVMVIYWVAQFILVNCVPFTRVSIFSGSQAAIRSLSGFVNNSRIVRAAAVSTLFLGASVSHWSGQLLGLDRDISTTVAMLTGHCVMGRHAERMRRSLNDFCRFCRSAEEEDHFLGAGIDYIVLRFLSDWRNYYLLTSRIELRS